MRGGPLGSFASGGGVGARISRRRRHSRAFRSHVSRAGSLSSRPHGRSAFRAFRSYAGIEKAHSRGGLRVYRARWEGDHRGSRIVSRDRRYAGMSHAAVTSRRTRCRDAMRRIRKPESRRAGPAPGQFETNALLGDQRIVRFGIAVGRLFSMLGPIASASTACKIFVEVMSHRGYDGLLGSQQAQRIERFADDGLESAVGRGHVPFSAFWSRGLSGFERVPF